MAGKYGTTWRALALTTALCSGSMVMGITPALAQTKAQVAADKAKDGQAKTGEEIPGEVELPQIDVKDSIGKASDNTGFATVSVSSATRTGTPITSIPRSIGVVPQEVIKTQQVLTVGEAVRNVAGVTLFEQGGRQQIYIRGFQASNSLTNGLLDPGLINRPLGSVERLEVLKGPASILVGNQPAGGVLNVILKKPLSVPFHQVTINGGSYGFLEDLVDLGGPLSRDGNLTFRFNGQVTHSDHSFAGYDGSRKYSVAPVIEAKIGAFDIITGGEYFYNRSPANPFTAAFPVFIAATDPRYPTLAARQAANRDIFADPVPIAAQVIGNSADSSTTRSLRGYYEATLKLGNLAGIDLTLRSRGQSAETTNQSSFFAPFAVQQTGTTLRAAYNGTANTTVFDNDGIQNDLVAKLKTGPIRHTILAGFDYQYQEQVLSNGQSYSTPFSTVTFDFAYEPFPNVTKPHLNGPYTLNRTSRLKQTGILVQDQLDIFDRLHVLLSTRFNHYDTDGATYAATRITRTTARFNKQGYNVGATYDITDWLTPYASYSLGFRPSIGGVSRGDDGVTGVPLPPEESTQYEIGAKSLLFQDKLSITLSGFDITTANTPLPAPARAGDRMSYSIAGAGQRSRGVEFELAGAITPNWNVLLTGTYQKVRGTLAIQGAGSNRDVAVAVPKYTGNLWTTYDIRSGPLNGLGFGLGEYVISETFGSNVRTPPYALTKASVFYSGIDNVTLRATVENAFDKRYYQPVQVNAYVPIGAPRTFLLTASTRF